MYTQVLVCFLMAVIISLMVIVSTAFAQAPDTLWTQTFGGNNNDIGNDVQQTTDGGFIIAGQTGFAGTFTSGDLWLIRTAATGDTLWTKVYGTAGMDRANSVQQTSDGGFIVAGYQTSADGFDRDLWLIRTDSQGDTLWTKTYGGNSTDDARSVQQTSDGGFIITGSSRSFGMGAEDVWLLRTDANGDTLWTRTYGEGGVDFGNSVRQTVDGGFIITGRFFSLTVGSPDLWLIRTDANGDTLWTRTYNGRYYPWSFDEGSTVRQTPDGGFIVAGETNGLPNTANTDLWVIRTDANGDTLWTNQFGGTGLEEARSLEQAFDGGFIFAGITFAAGSDIDAILVRTNSAGDSLWTIVLGDSGNDQTTAIRLTSDGGYIVSGYTSSYGAGDNDAWLIRLAPENPAGLGDNLPVTPEEFQLSQNYPNPFNPLTTIEYQVTGGGRFTLKIYDLLGKEVATLVNDNLAPGSYQVQWEGRDDSGQIMASGVYLYRFQSQNFVQTKKLMLLR